MGRVIPPHYLVFNKKFMKIKVLRPSAVASTEFSVGEYDINASVAQSLLNAGVAVSLEKVEKEEVSDKSKGLVQKPKPNSKKQ